jgi:hypothetical protein
MAGRSDHFHASWSAIASSKARIAAHIPAGTGIIARGPNAGVPAVRSHFRGASLRNLPVLTMTLCRSIQQPRCRDRRSRGVSMRDGARRLHRQPPASAWMRARSARDPLIASSIASSDSVVRSAAALFASACSTARDTTSAFVAPSVGAKNGSSMECLATDAKGGTWTGEFGRVRRPMGVYLGFVLF